MSEKKNQTWYRITNIAADTAEVRIYDDIGAWGITAKQFCQDFNDIKAAKIDLRINSYGGEVFDAAAISTAIREHPATVTGHVDGIAASSASVVACACDSIQIGKSAFMMIHNPLVGTYGNAGDLRKQAELLDQIAESIVGVYCDKTKKSKEEVTKAMNDETWFNATQAKAWGLADVIKNDTDDDDDEDSSNADNAAPPLASLLTAKFRNVPTQLIRAVAKAAAKEPTAQENVMLKVINRDGKSFVNIDGKDHEVETPAQIVAPIRETKPSGKTDEEVATAVADGVKKEREYRSMFNTALASAGLTGDAATKFETEFYGRSETDVKFLASHAVGTRAKAIGEGSGKTEEQLAKESKENPTAKVEDEAGKHFDEEPGLRRTYGIVNSDTASEPYKVARARYVAAARRRHLAEGGK